MKSAGECLSERKYCLLSFSFYVLYVWVCVHAHVHVYSEEGFSVNVLFYQLCIETKKLFNHGHGL